MNALDKSNLIKGAAMPAGYMALVKHSLGLETVTDADYKPTTNTADGVFQVSIHKGPFEFFAEGYYHAAEKGLPAQIEEIQHVYFGDTDLITELTSAQHAYFEKQILEQL